VLFKTENNIAMVTAATENIFVWQLNYRPQNTMDCECGFYDIYKIIVHRHIPYNTTETMHYLQNK
jgi:hypothetical protein